MTESNTSTSKFPQQFENGFKSYTTDGSNGEKYSSLGVKHVELLLECLAKLHSTCVLYEKRKSKEIEPPYDICEEYRPFVETCYLQKNSSDEQKWMRIVFHQLTNFIDIFPELKINKSIFQKKFEETITSNVSNDHIQEFKVICSMKSVSKQIKFVYENDEPVSCKLINISPLYRASPVSDVLLAIYATSNWKYRKYHLDDFLHHYYESFRTQLQIHGINLNTFLDRSEYQNTVRRYLPQIKILAALTRFQNIQESSTGEDKEFIFDILSELQEYFTSDSCIILPEDVYKIIKMSHQIEEKFILSRYTLESLDKSLGFLGEHKKLIVHLSTEKGEKVLKYFAKLYPKYSAFVDIVYDGDLFEKEIESYMKLVRDLKLQGVEMIDNCLPHCYFAIPNEIIVFEDLNEKHFKVGEHRDVMDTREIEIVLKTLAKFHASSIILEEIEGRKPLIEFYDFLKEGHFFEDEERPASKSFIVTTESLLHMIRQIFDNEDTTELTEYVKTLHKTATKLLKPTKKFRNVACHGDLWSANLLIKYDKLGQPEECRLIDLQLVRYTLPAHDFLFFIMFTTTHEMRKKLLKHFIDFYYTELSFALKVHNLEISSLLPYEEFIDGCNYIYPQVLFQVSTWYQVGQVAPEIMDEVSIGGKNVRELLYEDRKSYCETAYQQDANYREKTNEILSFIKIMFKAYKESNRSEKCEFLGKVYGIY